MPMTQMSKRWPAHFGTKAALVVGGAGDERVGLQLRGHQRLRKGACGNIALF